MERRRRIESGGAKGLGSARSHGGLVVGGTVYTELLAEPERKEEFVDRFFA
jgi:hypothetical protein